MAKLNYANRKSDGPKLGHIVAKDLRKQTTHCFAKDSPRPEPSPLSLELPGKKLTDEGCMAMVEGLKETLETHNGVTANKLEALNLSGNELTTASLRALADVIKLATFDLVDIDLSNNKITVKTDKEAENWQTFLESFTDCRVLRRIVLKGNSFSGPRAFETLARVYARQPPVDPTELEDVKEYHTEKSELEDVTNKFKNLNASTTSFDTMDSLAGATVLKRRQGLRAVPYIVLNDTNMTDSGALFFSYILAKHYHPQYLMCPIKPGPQATLLDEYNQTTHCWGLVYLPNDNLSDTGRHLLEQAEDMRAEFTGVEEDIDDGKLSGSVGSFLVVGAKQASAGLRGFRRRASTQTSDAAGKLPLDLLQVSTDSIKKHVVNMDIDNYRKKIQRNTIEYAGYESVDIWRVALKMLVYARVVMLGEEQDEDSPLPVVDNNDPVHHYASRMMATPSSTGEPLLAITGLTETPSMPELTDYTKLPRATAQGHGRKPSLLGQIFKSSPKKSKIPATIEAGDSSDRDFEFLGELPKDLWQSILAKAAGAEGVLSDTQQQAIMHYVRDPATCVIEQQDMIKPESVQLWRILDRVGCLEYEMTT